jgi:hypothetical protein
VSQAIVTMRFPRFSGRRTTRIAAHTFAPDAHAFAERESVSLSIVWPACRHTDAHAFAERESVSLSIV